MDEQTESIDMSWYWQALGHHALAIDRLAVRLAEARDGDPAAADQFKAEALEWAIAQLDLMTPLDFATYLNRNLAALKMAEFSYYQKNKINPPDES